MSEAWGYAPQGGPQYQQPAQQQYQQPPQQQGWGAPAPQQPQVQPGWGQPAQQGWGGPPQPQAPQQAQAALPEADDYFTRNGGLGSGAPSFDFSGVGVGVVGTIVSRRTMQQTTTGDQPQPKFFQDGSPMLQLEVTLQTPLRGWQGVKKIPMTKNPQGQDVPQDPSEDTGLRRIFVRYKMEQAIRDAILAAGATGLTDGWVLAIKVSGTEPNRKGDQPIKVYEARYGQTYAAIGIPEPTVQAPPAQQGPPPQQFQQAPAPQQQFVQAPPTQQGPPPQQFQQAAPPQQAAQPSGQPYGGDPPF